MQPGDVAFKSNFAYINTETRVVERRRVDRKFPEWGIPLCDALCSIKVPGFPDHEIDCKYATEHRCSVRVRGPRLSNKITGNDPLKDDRVEMTCTATQPEADAEYTAELIDKLSKEITKTLLEHPINI